MCRFVFYFGASHLGLLLSLPLINIEVILIVGNGICGRSIAPIYERGRCILVIGCITERSCPCSDGRIISGVVLVTCHLYLN